VTSVTLTLQGHHDLNTARRRVMKNDLNKDYRIYLCISRPFMTKKSTQKIALALHTSHTQRLDQAIQEISITIA